MSCAAIWIKLAEAPALTIAGNRMLIAILVLLPLTTLLARQELVATWSELRIPTLGEGSGAVAIGRCRLPRLGWTTVAGAALAAHFGLWTVSLDYTSVASSVVFVSTHPIFVALAEWAWLTQAPSRVAWLGIVATVLGSLFIGLSDLQIGGSALYGDFLAIGGALALVVYLIIGRRLRRELGFFSYSLLVFSPCWLILLLAGLFVGTSPLDFSSGDVPLFLALGLVSTLGGHAVFNWALGYVPASVVAVSFVAEPVVSSLLAWLILAQQPPALTLAGGAIILVGIYLAARY